MEGKFLRTSLAGPSGKLEMGNWVLPIHFRTKHLDFHRIAASEFAVGGLAKAPVQFVKFGCPLPHGRLREINPC